MIGDREMVIVLDNCEHVIDAAAAAAEGLLRHCSGVRLVATSREALRVPGETVWAVPPLAARRRGRAVRRARAGCRRAAGAVGRRACSRSPTSAPGSTACRWPSSWPQLAPARCRSTQISSRLNDRFRLLTGGSRTALPRQQTLAAVVDWSYDLLFDAEQRVFERLSVFPGGCDLATAEAVCADDAIAVEDIADLVAGTRRQVARRRAKRLGDTVRFTQLQTLSQYGHEKLTARGDAKRTRDAMAAHFAAALRGEQGCVHGSDAACVAARRDQSNTTTCAPRSSGRIANDDAETALVIAGGASWSHWLTGTAAEGARWLDDAFACAGAVTDQTRALGLAGRGLLRSIAGAFAAADDDLREALEIFRRHDDRAGVTFTLVVLRETARADRTARRGTRPPAARRSTCISLCPTTTFVRRGAGPTHERSSR